jgi:hypothetical protein
MPVVSTIKHDSLRKKNCRRSNGVHSKLVNMPISAPKLFIGVFMQTNKMAAYFGRIYDARRNARNGMERLNDVGKSRIDSSLKSVRRSSINERELEIGKRIRSSARTTAGPS